MPIYVYRQVQDGKPIGEDIEVFQHMSEPHLTEINGAPVMRVVTQVKTKPYWAESQGTSLALQINPSDLGEWQRDVPDLKINSHGQAVYDNDQHQRKVYKQMLAARERYEGPRRRAARLRKARTQGVRT